VARKEPGLSAASHQDHQMSRERSQCSRVAPLLCSSCDLGDKPLLLSIASGGCRGNGATSTDADSGVLLWVLCPSRFPRRCAPRAAVGPWAAVGPLPLEVTTKMCSSGCPGLGGGRTGCCGASAPVGQPEGSGSWRWPAGRPCPSAAWERVS